jgi:hypothetical protein
MNNKKRIFLVVAALALALTPAVSFAQSQTGFQKGDREFILSGSGSSDESFDNTSFGTTLSFGYFYTENLEASIRQDVSFTDIPGDNDWNGSTRLAGDYHFNFGPLVPLVGISLGYVYGDSIKDQFIVAPEAGLKYFFNETTFLYGLVEYQILFKDADEVDDAYDDGRFVYGIGLGLTF